MEVILNINDLKFKQIFKNICVNIEKNKFICISGPNSCGKTTLIRILSRELEIDNNIVLYGKNINEYKIEDYLKIIRPVIPGEIIFVENNLEEELFLQCDLPDKEKRILINYVIKGLKIRRMINKDFKTLSMNEVVLAQIALTLVQKPQIILFDNIEKYLEVKELENVYNFLRDYRLNMGLTAIFTTIDLNQSIYMDELYIIGKDGVVLSGDPITVLQRDNIINKDGLTLPFMVDLSVKLRDYDLIKNIHLDRNRMIEELWK